MRPPLRMFAAACAREHWPASTGSARLASPHGGGRHRAAGARLAAEQGNHFLRGQAVRGALDGAQSGGTEWIDPRAHPSRQPGPDALPVTDFRPLTVRPSAISLGGSETAPGRFEGVLVGHQD